MALRHGLAAARRLGVGLGIALLLAACSSLPTHRPVAITKAIDDFAQTPIGLMTDRALSGDPRSGFRVLPYGPNSLATRVELATLATRSIDAQYYLLQADETGLTLMRSLLLAAGRGVRVRILVDDLYTSGEDDVLLALAKTPNVEVRLFNPFPARGSKLVRFISSAWDFRRLDRRMHNKLFLADNAAAVVGGRNMADAYVMNTPGSNFIDIDAFAAGPVVRELSNEFDTYWNSETVFPVEQIARTTLSDADLGVLLEQRIASARPPQTADPSADGSFRPVPGYPASVSPVIAAMLRMHIELERGELGPLLRANARVLFDPPSKIASTDTGAIGGTVTEGVVHWMQSARHSIKMVSPYFVPSDQGISDLAVARKYGLRVIILTNSLASTDEPFAYGGYSDSVKSLLAMGVEVYELSPSLSVTRRKLGVFGKRTGALHLKEAIVDESEVFLGSMNLDPRSAWLNTEVGLIIDSAELAKQLAGLADEGSDYRLRLSPDGQQVRWVGLDAEGQETVYDEAPETSAWLRFKVRVLSALIPRSEL